MNNGVSLERKVEEEKFWQQLTLPVERKGWWWAWDGGYRWFESPNVIALERYRGPAEMARIRQVLLSRRS
jgi:hypothetical protein